MMRLPIVPGVRFRWARKHLGYCVGDDGSVWSSRGRWCSDWKQLRPSYAAKGYQMVRLGTEKQQCYVHHLVLEAFVSPRPPGMQCRHLNGLRTDNRLANLAWGTHEENCADTVRHGRTTIGARNASAKLTEEQAREVLALKGAGMSQTVVGARFGVGESCIRRIWRRQTWKHLAEGERR